MKWQFWQSYGTREGQLGGQDPQDKGYGESLYFRPEPADYRCGCRDGEATPHVDCSLVVSVGSLAELCLCHLVKLTPTPHQEPARSTGKSSLEMIASLWTSALSSTCLNTMSAQNHEEPDTRRQKHVRKSKDQQCPQTSAPGITRYRLLK